MWIIGGKGCGRSGLERGRRHAGFGERRKTLVPTGERVAAGLAKMVDMKKATAAAAEADARAAVRNAVLTIVGLSLIGIAIALVMGMRLGRQIVGGLASIERVARGAARGDLTGRTGVTTQDETGRAASALDSALAELSGTIDEVRHTSDRVSSSIASIIAQINDTQATIASAVDEQTATTNEMGRNVQEASGSSTQIARGLLGISGVANEAERLADESSRLMADLEVATEQLRGHVSAFTTA